MKKLLLLMHVSLDGFVGGPNGEMDWIQVDENIFRIAARCTENADIALYGRKTFEMMESYWPTAGDNPDASQHDIEHSQWYNSVRKVVVSKTINETEFANTTVISENIPGEINKLKQAGGKDILLIGSPSVIHIVLQENLVDEYWLMVNPVLLGQGIPLFKNITSTIQLKLEETKQYANGVIGLHYVK